MLRKAARLSFASRTADGLVVRVENQPTKAPRSNSQILVIPGAGHGSVHVGCVPRIAMRFFLVPS